MQNRSVGLIDGHIDDDIWEQLDSKGAYYDGYRCKKCGAVIIVEDAIDLPSYCKECEKQKADCSKCVTKCRKKDWFENEVRVSELGCNWFRSEENDSK